MGKDKKIKPQLAGGFRDYSPEEAEARGKMLDAIRRTFELFGFVLIETPAIEREETLTGGDPNFSKQIFRIAERNEKDPLALRYDLTVPLARFVAQNQNKLPWPFRRYQIGSVWRAEQPQAGRYREFLQCDSDIVGTDSLVADAEIIALIYETLTALKIPRFVIRIGNRRVLNGISECAGFRKEDFPAVLRAIDKMDKQGWGAVESGLSKLEGNPKFIKEALEISGKTLKNLFLSLNEFLEGSREATDGIKDLEIVANAISAMGIPPKFYKVDLSVARGLGYYTGIVFETILEDLPSIGSVCGGGRYDGLVSRFSPMRAPAVGMSIGIDRLYKACEELGISQEISQQQVLVLNFEPKCELYCAEILGDIRRAGIRAQIYLGQEKTLKGQFSYALKNNFGIVVIAGSDEKKKGVMQVRNLADRAQFEIAKGEVARRIAKLPFSKNGL